jgi:uncharacterized protein YecT (DUF1311 family)
VFLLICTIQVKGQREPVDRNTRLKIHPCQEVICIEENEDYLGESLFCLKCLLHRADSTMMVEYNNLLNRANSKKTKKAIEKSQNKWELDVDKKAKMQSDEFKGGAMETSEYIRERLLLTQKRILYLRNFKAK